MQSVLIFSALYAKCPYYLVLYMQSAGGVPDCNEAAVHRNGEGELVAADRACDGGQVLPLPIRGHHAVGLGYDGVRRVERSLYLRDGQRHFVGPSVARYHFEARRHTRARTDEAGAAHDGHRGGGDVGGDGDLARRKGIFLERDVQFRLQRSRALALNKYAQDCAGEPHARTITPRATGERRGWRRTAPAVVML